MNETQVQPPPVREDPSELERAAADLASVARELAVETERARRLPARLVAALCDSGLMRAGAPREVGGLELAPGTALRCAEQVARGDASAGWCVSIAITSSLLAAYLPPEGREELFGGGRGIAAGVWAPRGKARTTEGGVIVSGRWAFCSGISHADVLFGDQSPPPITLPPRAVASATRLPLSASKLRR